MLSDVFSEFAKDFGKRFALFLKKLLSDAGHILNEMSDRMMGQDVAFERGSDFLNGAIIIDSGKIGANLNHLVAESRSLKVNKNERAFLLEFAVEDFHGHMITRKRADEGVKKAPPYGRRL